MEIVEALTFDDVLLIPRRSPIISRKDVSTKTKLTNKISLNIPFVAANMDSVTESKMCIALAREGGVGIIHRFMPIEQQVSEVLKVKRSESILIEDPYTVGPNTTLKELANLKEEFGVKSWLVVDENRKLLGIVTHRDVKYREPNEDKITNYMTPYEKLITAPEGTSVEHAKEILMENRLEKIPIVDDKGILKGLITAKDIDRREKYPKAAKDTKGKLLVGAAIGVKPGYLERAEELLKAGADFLCVDLAHAHSDIALNTIREVKRVFGDIQIVAGNVATYEGARDLMSAGADCVKIGIGPGCFAAGTRILMSNGIYKNIEDVQPGEKVINREGKPVKVIKSFSTGFRDVNKIRTSIFYEDTYVTPDHRYWVADLNSTSISTIESRGYAPLLKIKSKTIPKLSKYKWKQIKDLKKDVLLMPKNIDFELPKSFEIKLKKRSGGNWRTGYDYTIDSVLTPSYELGYIFGTFLGNGSANTSKYKNSVRGSVRWYFGKNETKIADKLVECIKKTFNKECKYYQRKNIIQLIFYYKPLADFLKKFGKRENKNLPSKYLVNNKEYLKGLLDGLIYSDGNIEPGGRIRFTSTSKKLIELFGVLCYLVNGFFPNSAKRKTTTGSLNNTNIENFNTSYRSDIITTGKKRLTKKYQAIKLLSSEKTNLSVKVYDLEVDCPTHSFIANNSIVHNSTCTTRIMTGSGVPQITAIIDCVKASKEFGIPVIADGGMRKPGDVVKALACGAYTVMSGNIFAGTEETPGITVIRQGRKYKIYRGSASFGSALTRKSRESKDDIILEDYTPEGAEAIVPYKGSVKEVIRNFLGGLRSGMSYSGARTIEELHKNAKFIKITSAGLKESGVHDVNPI